MCDKISQFNVNKYVHLKDFLHKDSCAELTAALKDLVAQKQTRKDEQCPLSEAIHGAMTFDKLLVDLLPHFEAASGRKLYPTYSYARLYAPGDELVNHTDRESCEISATITLGFDGDVWPIYMGDDINKSNASEIRMNVGDAVLYQGMTKHHWREKYTEGKWQAQVFLHYVDANGKYADWKFDKRPSLNLPQEVPQEYQQWVYTDILTPDACDKIIATYDPLDKLPPIIGSGDGAINPEIRNVERVMLPVSFLNPDTECRKLTVLAFLNDDFEGGKFYFQIAHEKIYPPQEKGTVIVFPSFLPHGVEDIISGTRYSVVCWMVGKFFR